MNPDRGSHDFSATGLWPQMIGETDMSRAAQIFAPASAFTSVSEKSDSTLDPKLLFSGICFLALLVAMLTGVQGVWY